MGVYRRPDSIFWWLWLERPHLPPLRESTKVRLDASTPRLRRTNRLLAEQIYHARMGDLARERNDLPTERERISVTAFSNWYLENVTPTKRSHARERSMIRTLQDLFRGLMLHQLTRDVAIEKRRERLRDVATGTVNREYDVLKDILAHAVPRYLPASPLVGLARLRAQAGEKYEPRVLSREEEGQLLAAVDGEDQALLICAVDTLVRLTDAVTLKRSHDHGAWLSIHDPKEGTPYKVPVSTRLRAALDVLPRVNDWYFPKHHVKKHHYGATAILRGRAHRPSVGARAAQNSAIRMLKAACAAATIPYGREAGGITFHCLRHTGASRAGEAKASAKTLMLLGGWKDVRSVARYEHPSAAELQRIAEGIGAGVHVSLTSRSRQARKTASR